MKPIRILPAIVAGLAIALFTTAPTRAEITIGVNMAMTGPGASLAALYRPVYEQMNDSGMTIGSEPVRFVFLDDETDPSKSVRNARKLVTENNADVIVGSTFTPGCLAIANVANETGTPQLCLAPVQVPEDQHRWVFYVPQATTVMIGAVVDHMAANGVERVAYIGYADGWGDLVYSALQEVAPAAGIEIIADERYNRPDTSVTAQVLRIMSEQPDAVLVGASGTPAALPHTTLIDRGYDKQIYHTHGVIGPDFIRVGGSAVEGAIAPAGPLVVANQLPESNPIREVSLNFFAEFEENYPHVRNSFAGYAYDSILIVRTAAEAAMEASDAEPGTAEFRSALRDAIEGLDNVVGTHAVYDMTEENHNGVDERAAVLVRVEDGEFQLLQQ